VKGGEKMKRGISVERTRNYRGQEIVRVRKQRGRLTLEEVQDALRDQKLNAENWNQPFFGHYAIILHCQEESGAGYLDEDEPEGDTVELYQLEDSGDCPVCGAMLPSFEYCPHCGKPWKWTEESDHELAEEKPLTLDELLEMDGEPVFVTHSKMGKGWCVIDWHGVNKSWTYFSRTGTAEGMTAVPIRAADYGESWQAYRRKPEGNYA
jgi:hypothetical protein